MRDRHDQQLHRGFRRWGLDHVVSAQAHAFHDCVTHVRIIFDENQAHATGPAWTHSYVPQSFCPANAHRNGLAYVSTKPCCQHFAIVSGPFSLYDTEMIQLPTGDADRDGTLLHNRVAELESLSVIACKELEASQAALAGSERRLHAILEGVTDYAVITTDLAGRVVSWNAGACRILGWEEAEMLRQDAALIWTTEDRDAGAPEVERRTALAQGSVADERWYVRRDGTRVRASGYLTPLGDEGVPGFLKILHDRSAWHLAETALVRSEALPEAETQRHQSQRMETMGRLTSGVAHDFNNLLQGIGSNLDMAQLRVEQGRAAEVHRYVETAHEGVNRAAALTARLLAYARRQPLQPCVVNPGALILGIAELLKRTIGPTICGRAVLGRRHLAGAVRPEPASRTRC